LFSTTLHNEGVAMDSQSIRDRLVGQKTRHVDAYVQHYTDYGSKAAEHMLSELAQSRLEIYQEVLKIEELGKPKD
jgi:hypothetical protein